MEKMPVLKEGFRFGVFEVDLEGGELRKSGLKVADPRSAVSGVDPAFGEAGEGGHSRRGERKALAGRYVC